MKFEKHDANRAILMEKSEKPARKMESFDRILIDFSSYWLIFTILFGTGAFVIHGLLGVQADIKWYLLITASSFAYTFLYYDARILFRCLPFLRPGKWPERALILILLAPALLPVFDPQGFPRAEYHYWLGIYILFSVLLNLGHVGIYDHAVMKSIAKGVFMGTAMIVALLYIVMPPDHLKTALPMNAVYIILLLTLTTFLLHLLRVENRSESFVRKELLLIALLFLVIALLFFSGAFDILADAVNRIFDGLAETAKAAAKWIPNPSSDTANEVREVHSTLPVTTYPNIGTTPIYSYEGASTTDAEEETPLKPVNFWIIIVPLSILAAAALYLMTKKKKIGEPRSALFVEEREEAPAFEAVERRKRRRFARKTALERVRLSYRRFMKYVPSPSDTTSNLQKYGQLGGVSPSKSAAAEALTEVYRRARYIDHYQPSEEEAREAEQNARRTEIGS